MLRIDLGRLSFPMTTTLDCETLTSIENVTSNDDGDTLIGGWGKPAV